MELNKVFEERRSIRKYNADKKISKEEILELIKYANLAPSWKNKQTSRYHIVMSEDKKNILLSCMPEFNINSAHDAPVLIITTFVKDIVGFNRDGQADNEIGNGWGFYDLGLNNENLLLKAKEMGFDTLVMGLRDADKIRKNFDIPQNETIVSIIALGYADQEGKMPPRKDLEEISKFY